MRLGLLADSHDHCDRLRQAVSLLRDREVEAVLHAGDFIAPFTIPILGEVGCPIEAVFGNNDAERIGLARKFEGVGEVGERPRALTLGGRSILLCHEPFAVEELNHKSPFDLIVYGHTHQSEVRQGDTLIVNPGEVCGWVTGKAGCALIDLSTMAVELLDLQ